MSNQRTRDSRVSTDQEEASIRDHATRIMEVTLTSDSQFHKMWEKRYEEIKQNASSELSGGRWELAQDDLISLESARLYQLADEIRDSLSDNVDEYVSEKNAVGQVFRSFVERCIHTADMDSFAAQFIPEDELPDEHS